MLIRLGQTIYITKEIEVTPAVEILFVTRLRLTEVLVGLIKRENRRSKVTCSYAGRVCACSLSVCGMLPVAVVGGGR